MEQRRLGSTGLNVSALGFGSGSVGGLMVRGRREDQIATVQRALELGITYFDTAASYGNGRSEENLGAVLKQLGARDRIVLGTKLTLQPGEVKDTLRAERASLQASLKRLQTDRVDLIQIHNRIGGPNDSAISAAELVGTVVEGARQLIGEGLARFVGFTGLGETPALQAAVASGRLDTMQSYFNALNPSARYAARAGGAQDYAGVINAAVAQGMGVLAIRVLAGGAMSGSAERAENASDMSGASSVLSPGSEFTDDVRRAQKLAALSQEFGFDSTVELALRFALSQPGISTVLVGLSDISQLEEAVRWAEKGPLTDDAVQSIVDAA